MFYVGLIMVAIATGFLMHSVAITFLILGAGLIMSEIAQATMQYLNCGGRISRGESCHSRGSREG